MAEGVILLHGIFRTHRSMRGLEKAIKKAGFRTLNIGYPSTKMNLQELVEFINPEIKRFSASVEGRLHFVGYSMGGLLIRAYINRYRPASLGRVVMIGTPNNGSEVADFLKDIKIYKKLYGPAGQQLVTDQKDFRNIFGNIDYELGVIAGNRPFDLISSKLIGKPNDGKVSVESTRTENMKDHIIIRCNHTYFPSSRRAHKQVIYFLRNGVFEH